MHLQNPCIQALLAPPNLGAAAPGEACLSVGVEPTIVLNAIAALARELVRLGDLARAERERAAEVERRIAQLPAVLRETARSHLAGVDCRHALSVGTFHRHRHALLSFGFDIGRNAAERPTAAAKAPGVGYPAGGAA